jgi:hypothetical protein
MMPDLKADFFGPRFVGRRYLRANELIELGVVGNVRTLRNLVRSGELPPPIKLGRLLLFPTTDLAERLMQLAAQRRCS